MALNPSNSSSLDQLVLKGLNTDAWLLLPKQHELTYCAYNGLRPLCNNMLQNDTIPRGKIRKLANEFNISVTGML